VTCGIVQERISVIVWFLADLVVGGFFCPATQNVSSPTYLGTPACAVEPASCSTMAIQGLSTLKHDIQLCESRNLFNCTLRETTGQE
jgi:hypothetical protein